MNIRPNATVTVQRRGSVVANKIEVGTGWVAVYATASVLIEPMGSWRKANILGVAGGRRFEMSWDGPEELRDGDRVIWLGRNYRLEFNTDDRYRADGLVSGYQTAILHEEGA